MPKGRPDDPYERERAALVSHLQRQGIRDERVLTVIGKVPRERFVPPELEPDAYMDRALPIGSGQTISQPFVVARMTELLRPRATDHVLEVGTGSAYQAAVLARLVRDVVSIERRPELAERAARLLEELGVKNVRVVVGDGTLGFAEAAPYDSAIITAATPKVPEPIVEQVRMGGRIVAPVGDREMQTLVVVTRRDGLERQGVEGVKFVPLVGKRGFEEPEG